MDELLTNLWNRLFLTFNFQKSVDCGKFENVELSYAVKRVVRSYRQYMDIFLYINIPPHFQHSVENMVELQMFFTFQLNMI